MLTGLNHLTLAVADLDRSFDFYTCLLGAKPHARWLRGAYLTLGNTWICLSLDSGQCRALTTYTHYAFSCDDFADQTARLRSAGVTEWQVNQSEGDSVYFLDPDGHRLELHTGDLASRLAACRAQPYDGMVFFD
jgi:catechol 2,3-dioxygenase-like lactoylglutathione lyase family enzyme